MSLDAFLRQGFLPFEAALRRQPSELTRVVATLRSSVRNVRRVPERPVFVAIGASLAAVAPAVELLRGHGIAARRVNAAELEHRPSADPGDLVVAVSQSGRSRETVGALRHVTSRTLAIVNVTDSPIAARTDEAILLGDLPDSLASTIGYTATVAAASMLAESWALGAPSPHWDSLGDRLAVFLTAVPDEITLLAELLDEAHVVDVVAPVEHLGAAEAAALLLREVPRVPAAPFESRQYLHGLMEAAGPGTLHLVFDGPDSVHLLPSLAKGSGRVLRFGSNATTYGPEGDGVLTISPPAVSAAETSIFTAAVLQQAARLVSRSRSIDPDEFLFLDTDIKLGDEVVEDNEPRR
ncbi:SIS domain-containing protein [Rhizohabitans arisaemae]|uniref:SIS domain-containing protein n=1 Tax=Rhizohabitans arisaemae TaxID=2720610 RepID=UPI0024B11242|nr:SIS domain-containing protein [Rhizohabitans arisaemae]